MENVGNFGVELELINVNKQQLIDTLAIKNIDCIDSGYTHAVTRHWKLVNDASIQGTGGVELVSPILNGIEGMKELREVCLALYFINAKVNSSCGLHVHHQAPLGLNDSQKTNLMKFYARLERTIDAFMPANRKRNTNHFCKSMVQAYNECNGWNNLSDLGRYYKLNFAALSRQNTLEFRQHGGTIEFEKIYHWVVFTAQFIAKCKDKVSRSQMNYIERAWTKKHLSLSNRTWTFFKSRMKKLDDLSREEQGVVADMSSLEYVRLAS